MPTYEYECGSCGRRLEIFQRISEPALRKCPKCGKLRLARLISGGAGIIFKGSGFYETDYRRNRRGGDPAAKEPAAGGEAQKPAATKREPVSQPGGGSASDSKAKVRVEPKAKQEHGDKKRD
jgi:putative FmdB family regulatory protein